MIVSHYLSEPDNNPVSTPHAGSDRPGRLFSSPFRAARSPFKRLEFWTASHPLSYKLRLYSVSEPKVNMWRGFTWETLRYWNDLMSGEEPEPDLTVQIVRRWYEDLTSDDPERRAYALEEAGVAHAEPFAD